LQREEARRKTPIRTMFDKEGMHLCNYFLHAIQRKDREERAIEAIVIAPRTKYQRIVRKSRRSKRVLHINKIHVCSTCMKLPALLSWRELKERVYQVYSFPDYVHTVLDKAMGLYFDDTQPPRWRPSDTDRIRMLIRSYEELLQRKADTGILHQEVEVISKL